MIRRIFLDLDDTLNSFTLHILGSVIGLDVGPYDYDRFPVDVGYNIVEAYRRLRPSHYPEYTDAQFWSSIPRHAWANAPKSPQFNILLDRAEALVGRENIFIFTSATKDPDCLAGKLEWIHEFLPPWLHRQYFIGDRKHVCAQPDTLLIDDSDMKINNFRKAGGRTLLIPRPWNSLHGTDTTAYVICEFDFLTRRY